MQQPSARTDVRASGALVLEERKVLEEMVGRDALRRALDSLPDPIRREYELLTAAERIRVPTVEAVYEAAAREIGREPLRLHRDIVRTGVERTLKTLWRMLLRFTTDEALVARTPLIYSRTFDTGRLESRIVSPGLAHIRLTGWPDVSEMQMNGLATGIETVLRCAGRKNVRVTYDRASDGAIIIATWSV